MAVDVLFVALGSLVVAVTVAVLEAVVPELKVLAVTLIVMMARLPTFSVPRLQVTVPAACEQDPWVVETDVKLTCAGSGSLTLTP